MATGLSGLRAQNARIQLIHNSADILLDTLDVYLNDSLVAPHLAFRNASPFIPVHSSWIGQEVGIFLCPKNSTSNSPAYFQGIWSPSPGATIAVINGVYQQAFYPDGQSLHFDFDTAATLTSQNPNQADLVFHHGSDDTPAIDIAESSTAFPDMYVDNLTYGSFSATVSLDSGIYRIGMYDDETVFLALNYAGYFHTPNSWGQRYTMVLSGFQLPEQNQNAPVVAMYVADTTGGPMYELFPATILDSLYIQLVHNVLDVQDPIDVYRNGTLWIDDLNYLHSSPFVKIPANQPDVFKIANGTSVSAADAFYNASFSGSTEQSYIGVFSGLKEPAGNTPPAPARFDVFEPAAHQSEDPVEVDALLYHGSPDLGDLMFRGLWPANTTLSDNHAYGTFRAAGYMQILPFDYTFDLYHADDDSFVSSVFWPAQTNGLAGEAVLLLISGFADPAQNENGPELGLWYGSAAGGALVPCGDVTGIRSVNPFNGGRLSPNPATHGFRMDGQTTAPEKLILRSLDGRVVQQWQGYSSWYALDPLAKGTYILEVQSAGTAQAFRLQIAD